MEVGKEGIELVLGKCFAAGEAWDLMAMTVVERKIQKHLLQALYAWIPTKTRSPWTRVKARILNHLKRLRLQQRIFYVKKCSSGWC